MTDSTPTVNHDAQVSLAQGADAQDNATNVIINSEKAKSTSKVANIASGGTDSTKVANELAGLKSLAKELQKLIGELKKLETEIVTAKTGAKSPVDSSLLNGVNPLSDTSQVG